jgi:excisionase family DNA binding protein
MSEQLLKVAQYAERTQCSERHVRQMVKDGRIPRDKVTYQGKAIRIHPSALPGGDQKPAPTPLLRVSDEDIERIAARSADLLADRLLGGLLHGQRRVS